MARGALMLDSNFGPTKNPAESSHLITISVPSEKILVSKKKKKKKHTPPKASFRQTSFLLLSCCIPCVEYSYQLLTAIVSRVLFTRNLNSPSKRFRIRNFATLASKVCFVVTTQSFRGVLSNDSRWFVDVYSGSLPELFGFKRCCSTCVTAAETGTSEFFFSLFSSYPSPHFHLQGERRLFVTIPI
jgi:hypothetical protein